MTHFPSLPVALLLVACTEPSEPEGSDAPGDPPSPYIVPEGDPPEPTATLAEVGAALQEALDLAFTVHGGPVHESYDKAMEGASGSCPYVYTTADGSYWYDNCVSDAGTAFDGYVFSLDADEVYDPTYGFTYSFWYAFGGATVVDANGHTLEVGGGAVTQKVSDQVDGVNLAEYYSMLEGTFAWDGTEADGTWLESEIDPDLELYAYAATDFGVSFVQLSGGFGGVLDGWAVAFDTNGVGAELLGFPCEEELSGTIGVRAPDGTWTDVQFDGVVDAEALDTFDEALCDGCGEAFFQGEALGEVCVDVSTLLAAGVAPW
jgi:hypothetical protein